MIPLIQGCIKSLTVCVHITYLFYHAFENCATRSVSKKKVWYQYASLFTVKICKKYIFKIWNVFWKGRIKHLTFYLNIAIVLLSGQTKRWAWWWCFWRLKLWMYVFNKFCHTIMRNADLVFSYVFVMGQILTCTSFFKVYVD